ncbi:unnamed protein product [Closterium sp. Naga37s-1]|nr:unnamed protein product [Closterium sp. Naga37s-1]
MNGAPDFTVPGGNGAARPAPAPVGRSLVVTAQLPDLASGAVRSVRGLLVGQLEALPPYLQEEGEDWAEEGGVGEEEGGDMGRVVKGRVVKGKGDGKRSLRNSGRGGEGGERGREQEEEEEEEEEEEGREAQGLKKVAQLGVIGEDSHWHVLPSPCIRQLIRAQYDPTDQSELAMSAADGRQLIGRYLWPDGQQDEADETAGWQRAAKLKLFLPPVPEMLQGWLKGSRGEKGERTEVGGGEEESGRGKWGENGNEGASAVYKRRQQQVTEMGRCEYEEGKVGRRVEALRRRIAGMQPAGWQEFVQVVQVLAQADALDPQSSTLMPLGEIAAKVSSDMARPELPSPCLLSAPPSLLCTHVQGVRGVNELWIAVALSHPSLPRLSPPAIAGCCAALVSEGMRMRTGDGSSPFFPYKPSWQVREWVYEACSPSFPYEPSWEVQKEVYEAEERRDWLMQLQLVANVAIPADLDAQFAGVVEAWAQGVTWLQLIADCAGLDEGDIARLLRRTNDILSHVCCATSLLQPTTVSQRSSQSITSIIAPCKASSLCFRIPCHMPYLSHSPPCPHSPFLPPSLAPLIASHVIPASAFSTSLLLSRRTLLLQIPYLPGIDPSLAKAAKQSAYVMERPPISELIG